jgi:hypothetical protein
MQLRTEKREGWNLVILTKLGEDYILEVIANA